MTKVNVPVTCLLCALITNVPVIVPSPVEPTLKVSVSLPGLCPAGVVKFKVSSPETVPLRLNVYVPLPSGLVKEPSLPRVSATGDPPSMARFKVPSADAAVPGSS